MRLKILRNLGRGFPPYKDGDLVEVDDKLGDLLLSQHLAELQSIHAVPPAAEIIAPEGSVEKATSDFKAYRAKATHETTPKSANKE